MTATLPGASPETMASSVATPLEKQFTAIPGLEKVSSTSALGTTSITLEFALDRDIDAAALDVQSAISKAARSLPADMPTPPSFRKVEPGRLAHPDPRPAVGHASALRGERVRRDGHRPAALDGAGSRPGRRVRRAEARGPRPGRPRPAGWPAHRHRRGVRRPSRTRTSTCRPGRSRAIAGPSTFRPPASS